ncbi:hypothetical protein MK489_10085 [Myxococcota bacterium]|nr:hypothetical protein [Myxococcota bacterium]
MRARIRGGLLGFIGVAYLVSIPWYREPGATVPLLWGLPSWVTVAIGCYVVVAVANCLAWLLTEIDDAPRDEDRDDVS